MPWIPSISRCGLGQTSFWASLLALSSLIRPSYSLPQLRLLFLTYLMSSVTTFFLLMYVKTFLLLVWASLARCSSNSFLVLISCLDVICSALQLSALFYFGLDKSRPLIIKGIALDRDHTRASHKRLSNHKCLWVLNTYLGKLVHTDE